MTPAQAFEVLEKVKNWADAFHKSLQQIQEKMRETGFEGQYQDQIAVIEARLAKLVAMADSLRAAAIQQQGGSNA